MAVRKFKPTTPGQRHKVIGVFKGVITATTPEKSLTVGKRSTGGRNNEGHLANRYMGGGHKRKYRIIDFKRNRDGIPAVVKSIEYDPNRSARIALLYYVDGAKAYIVAPSGLEVGATVVSGENAGSRGRQRPSPEQNPRRYTHPLYRTSSRPGCLHGPLCRHFRTAHISRRQLCHHQATFRRNTQNPCRVQGYNRRGRQRRALARALGQGRPFALARQTPPQPWRCHEPCRPPHGW